jgi:hypothetical protein
MRVEDFSMLMRMINSVNNDLAEAEGKIIERVKGKLEIILNEMYILRSQFEEVEQPMVLEENIKKVKDYDCKDTYAEVEVEEDFDDDKVCITTEQPTVHKEYCQ